MISVLKTIMNKIIFVLRALTNFLLVLKVFIGELINIFSKRKLAQNVCLTDDQNKEMKSVWKGIYGINIPNWWHRLYTSYTGNFDCKYFPEILYTTRLEGILNPIDYIKAYEDKSMLSIFFNKIDENYNIRTPKIYLINTDHVFCDGNGNIITKNRAIEKLFNLSEAIIKPSIGSNSGKNIMKISINDCVEQRSELTVNHILKQYNCNYIVQESLMHILHMQH